MRNVFQVRVEVRERGASYFMREGVFVIAKNITRAQERAEKHVRASFKRRSVTIVAMRTVAIELIGQAVT